MPSHSVAPRGEAFSKERPLKRHFAILFGISSVAALLSGCDTLSSINPFDTTEKYKTEIVPEVPAEKLYNEGLARVKSGDYEGAGKRFADLDKQHPFSNWSQKGLLMTAYSNFEAKSYDDAATAAKRYLTLHPSSPDAAYAQYLLATSYYNQVPEVTRDQDRAEKALVALQELVDRYPKSEYVQDARYKITVVRDQLAGREMAVGRFYLQRRNYTAAVNRFRDVVAKYQTTRHVEEALMRLTECYMALGVVGEAQTAAAVLGHNFPDSTWYNDAYRLLQSGGVEPREDKTSWISRSFRNVARAVVGSN